MEEARAAQGELMTCAHEAPSGGQASPLTKGYLIALVQEDQLIKIFGSPADRSDCDEILEINGKCFSGEPVEEWHAHIVRHIHECIKLRNICLKVKRAPISLHDSKNSSLLDVFVIGTNAHEQLDRFFKITNILANSQDSLKLTANKMELAEFNNANQTTVNGNGTPFTINQQQIISNQQSQAQQLTNNQINNSGNPHLYRNHQPPQGLRYVNNPPPKVPKHRELPVDVPDSWVGYTKQSPRYPPPKPHRQVSPSMPLNNLTSFNHPPPSMPYNSNPVNTATNNFNQQPSVSPLSQNTAANIANHNSSLRSSIKLKQLEKSRNGHPAYPVGQMQPAVNQAFELNEDDAIPIHDQTAENQTVTDAKKNTTMKPSMPDLRSIYNRLQSNLDGEFADVSGDAKLAQLLSIYNTIVQTHNKKFRLPNLTSRHKTTINAQGIAEPVTYKVSDLIQSVTYLLRDEEMTDEAADLFTILCRHEVDGVCSAFDRISQSFEFAKSSRSTSPQSLDTDENGFHHPQVHSNKQETRQLPNNQLDDYDYATDQVQMDIENNLYQNSLHPLTDIDLRSGTSTKTVRIEKTSNQALGATIKNDVDGTVIIGRIVCGGAAHNSGLLHEGDEILEVNGVQMRGKNVNEVVNILEGMNGTLEFTVISRVYDKPPRTNLQEKTFVRAFFSYDGSQDDFVPCKELGLSFEKGDILTILDRSDPKWWQAQRERDSECSLAGLIPSISFLKQREKDSDNEEIVTPYFKHEKKTLVSMLFNCPKGTSPRHRKKNLSIPFGSEENPYYEEVCLHYPNKKRPRPIILIGPKMIGQTEIRAKLLLLENRFASAISHTSKPRQSHERDGVDFHFVSRAQFEADIKAGRFIECGQYQNQYYGTSIDAMMQVVRSQKTCIQIVNLSSMGNLRHGIVGSELKPFFVFVKPDDSHPEKLRNIVSSFSPPKSNIEENLKEIRNEVRIVEERFLPYFDLVITVSDVDRSYRDLLDEIEKIEKEPQWIPSIWRDLPPSSNNHV